MLVGTVVGELVGVGVAVKGFVGVGVQSRGSLVDSPLGLPAACGMATHGARPTETFLRRRREGKAQIVTEPVFGEKDEMVVSGAPTATTSPGG